MVGLAAGIVSATTGRLLVAASLGGLGALVFGVGYWMYTRGA